MPVLFFGHRKHMLDPGDDVLAWGESLEHLLQSKTGQLLFEDFLRTEYSEENLLFWLACEDYKTITSQAEMRVAAKNIYEEFVQVDAPRQVEFLRLPHEEHPLLSLLGDGADVQLPLKVPGDDGGLETEGVHSER
ncbi:regulator of G-protein signaling 5-like isoform 3-T3 [Spinachia spinachia]